MSVWIEIGGWIGSACLLSAYFLVARRKLASDGWRFHSLNLVGAALLLLNALHHGAWALASVEGAWMGIAGWGLIAWQRKKQAATDLQ